MHLGQGLGPRRAGMGRRGEGKGEETLASLLRLPHPHPTSTPSGGGGGAGQPRGCRQQLQRPAPPPRPRPPGRARARSAARGAAAGGDGKVAGASADMPGSDTALTVDRTYSDPGRHHRCKSRVRGAGGAAVGAPPGRGARPGGLWRRCSPTLAARLSPPASLPPRVPPAAGPRRRGWGGGGGRRGQSRARPAGPRPPSPLGSPRACRTRAPGVPDGPALRHPPPGSARRAVPGREGIPAAAAPVGRRARPPDLACCPRLRSPRGFGRGPAEAEADGLPGLARRLPRLCPSGKSAFAAAAPEFPAVPSGRPLHCLQCNLLLLILAVGENSSSEQAAETSLVVLQNKDGGRSLGAGPSRQRRPPPARGSLCLPGLFSPSAD